ncbi:hypothetical protein [Thioclava sp. NG1]|uniref:hypothetical protein n=1 Tax=Thioclava sp. NG1 TaxID=2182426 RepID=UPI001304EA0A|nr:hypothetical protein [Thioclava sp. NG1]
MLNNIGFLGLAMIALVVVLPIWLIAKLANGKAKGRKRIADAIEEIAKSQSDKGQK